MSKNFEHDVDPEMLAEMMRWAASMPLFRLDHATYGLYCTTNYLRGWADLDREGRILFALNLSYWWWFDDLIDKRMEDASTNLAWGALEDALRAGLPPGDYPPEVEYLRKLSEDLRPRARAQSDHDWWIIATLGTALGFRDEEHATRTKTPVSYAEQLEAGLWSATLVNVTAAASVLLGMGLGDRHPAEPSTLERLLCLVARLENDRFSVDKERHEGCASNVLIVLERSFPREHVAAFVEAQQRGYERCLMDGLGRLGADHPFAHLARGILETHREFYASRPGRYVPPSGSSA